MSDLGDALTDALNGHLSADHPAGRRLNLDRTSSSDRPGLDRVAGDDPEDFELAPSITVNVAFTGRDNGVMRAREVTVSIPVADLKPADYAMVIRATVQEIVRFAQTSAAGAS